MTTIGWGAVRRFRGLRGTFLPFLAPPPQLLRKVVCAGRERTRQGWLRRVREISGRPCRGTRDSRREFMKEEEVAEWIVAVMEEVTVQGTWSSGRARNAPLAVKGASMLFTFEFLLFESASSFTSPTTACLKPVVYRAGVQCEVWCHDDGRRI